MIGEQREGKLHPVTLELIGEGRKLADESEGKLYVAVPGYDIDDEVAKLLHYQVDGVFYLKHPLLKHFSTDGYVKAISDSILERKPQIVLVGATSIGTVSYTHLDVYKRQFKRGIPDGVPFLNNANVYKKYLLKMASV